jgi:hypothetical protein
LFQRTARPGLLGPNRYGSLFFHLGVWHRHNANARTMAMAHTACPSPTAHDDVDEPLVPVPDGQEYQGAGAGPDAGGDFAGYDGGGMGIDLDLGGAAEDIEVARDAGPGIEGFNLDGPAASASVLSLPWSTTPAHPPSDGMHGRALEWWGGGGKGGGLLEISAPPLFFHARPRRQAAAVAAGQRGVD